MVGRVRRGRLYSGNIAEAGSRAGQQGHHVQAGLPAGISRLDCGSVAWPPTYQLT